MIIGETNLIIGRLYSVISYFSISVFFYIEKQTNYFLKSIIKIARKIIPVSNAPPKF